MSDISVSNSVNPLFYGESFRTATTPAPVNLFKAIVSVSALTTLSRVAGLAREVVTAKVFGAGAVNDASRLPSSCPT